MELVTAVNELRAGRLVTPGAQRHAEKCTLANWRGTLYETRKSANITV
ncbi:hypothetical protein [Nocardia brasiliensis]|nr:hypothetical protein [Nocardia brasiliensis]